MFSFHFIFVYASFWFSLVVASTEIEKVGGNLNHQESLPIGTGRQHFPLGE